MKGFPLFAPLHETEALPLLTSNARKREQQDEKQQKKKWKKKREEKRKQRVADKKWKSERADTRLVLSLLRWFLARNRQSIYSGCGLQVIHWDPIHLMVLVSNFLDWID